MDIKDQDKNINTQDAKVNTKEPEKNSIDSSMVAEMLKVGVHLGHKKSKFHPAMDQYVLFVRNNIRIIDVEQTAEKIKDSAQVLEDVVKNNGTILFVSTIVPANRMLKEIALKLNMPYVVNRWLGGTLTNFSTIAKRLEYFLSLEKKREAGELEKYTKKERVMFDKEIQDLNKKFEGIKNMKKLPDAVFIVNAGAHQMVLREAERTNIPVTAICDTDSDPRLIKWVIPANDSSVNSLNYILDKVFGKMIEAGESSKSSETSKSSE